jgi:hypothetical protein
MMRKLAIVAGLAVVLAAGAIRAGTPFGGDDSGTVSSSSTINKCENGVGKGVAKLAAGILKCHAGRVTGKQADDTAEDACESAARTKFTTKTKTANCGPCTNLTTISAAVEGLVDGNNNKVYCSSAGGAFSGDDTGTIPSDAPKGPISKCENKVGKAVGKLVGGIAKCHSGRASGKFADDTAEDACEGTALGKFNATSTTGCAPCTNLATLGAFVESTVDGANALVYCASPSGAFLN